MDADLLPPVPPPTQRPLLTEEDMARIAAEEQYRAEARMKAQAEMLARMPPAVAPTPSPPRMVRPTARRNPSGVRGRRVMGLRGPRRSFIYQAVVVFLLYELFWIPGLIFNLMWLREASEVERQSGVSPHGKGCLTAMLVWGVFSLVAILLFGTWIARRSGAW